MWLTRRALDSELEACHAIRQAVFVLGQGVSTELDRDGLDAVCVHFLVYEAGRTVGTARLREVGGAVKAERVAVLEDARRRGAGRALMLALEAEARRMRATQVVLSAQEASIPFYARLGYVPVGESYDEAGIRHRRMYKSL